MKKVILVFSISLLVLSGPGADEIDLGKFPIGNWQDPVYDAQWSFASDNIQLYQDGKLVFDFRNRIEDFALKVIPTGVEMSFRCPDAGRSYKFVNGLTSTDIKMIIDKDSGVHFEVDMKKQ